MRRDLCALVAMFALSGCLPSRDNTLDPKNRPTASLALVDMRAVDGSCATDPDAVDPADVVVVGIAKRSACLALDARGTRDPQGSALRQMTFTFGRRVGGEIIEPFAAGDVAVAGTGLAVALLSTSYIADLALDTPIEFGVLVEDDEGSRDASFASLTLQNARPVARLDGGGSVRPVPGATQRMTFDGSRSFDEDGDPLTYCWDFPGDDPDDGCTSDAVISHDVPIDHESRYGVTLRVRDGATTIPSHPAAVAVRVGPPNIFLLSRQDGVPGAVARRLDSAATFSPLQAGFTAPLPGDRLAIVYEDDDVGRAIGVSKNLDVPAAPLAIDFEDMAPPFGPSYAVALDSSGSTVQLLSRGTFDPGLAFGEAALRTWLLQTFLVDGTSVSPSQTTPTRTLVDQADLDFGVFNPWTFLVAIDGAGNTWMTRRDLAEPATVVFGAAGVDDLVPMEEEDDSLGVRSIVRRPGTNEIWAARAALDASTANAELAVLESVGGTPAIVRRIGLSAGRTAHELAWWTKELLWIATEEDGVLLVDADLLGGPGGVDAATLLHVPGANLLHGLVVDPFTGSLHGTGPSGDDVLIHWEIHTDGRVREHPPLDASSYFESILVGIDSNGLQVLSGDPLSSKFLHRGLANRNRRSEASFVVPAAPLPAFGAGGNGGQAGFVDPATGGIWVVADELGSRSLSLFGEDGSLLRSHAFVFSVPLGDFVTPPDLTDARLSPNGTTIWFFSDINTGASYANLNRLDLTQDPPVLEAVTVSGGPVAMGGYPNANNVAYGMWIAMRDNELFEPAAAPDDFVWAQYLDHLYRLSPDGTLTDTGAVLANPDWASASLLPSTNSLCVVMRGSLADPFPFTVETIAPNGTITPLGAVANVGDTTGAHPIVGTVGVSDPLGDSCWTVVAEPNGALNWMFEVDRWDLATPGTPQRTAVGFNTPGPIRSLAAVTRDALFLAFDDAFSNNATAFAHVPFRDDGSYDDYNTVGPFPQSELISAGGKNTSSQDF